MMLTAADPLPNRPRKILVAGVSGVGKTTLASRLADITGSPHTEIDALFHGPGWTPRPAFETDVDAMLALPAWITEWQYGLLVRERLAEAADILVWLDLPYWRVTFPRVVKRTVLRRLRREPLWNGNVEEPLWKVFTNPEHIIRWSVSQRHALGHKIHAAQKAYPGITIVRLRSRQDVATWFNGPLAVAVRKP